MFEKTHQELITFDRFILRLAKSLFLGLTLIIIAVCVGILGYHYYEGMSWIDAFLNASMILSGMGPATPLHTVGGKLFAGFYALFSGLIFIAVIAIAFSPIIHRFLHHMHTK